MIRGGLGMPGFSPVSFIHPANLPNIGGAAPLRCREPTPDVLDSICPTWGMTKTAPDTPTPAEAETIHLATLAYAAATTIKNDSETEHRETAAKVEKLVRRAANLAGDVEKARAAKQRGEMTDAQRARAAALLAGHEAPPERGLEQMIDELRLLQDDVTITRSILIEMAQAVREATRVWGVRRGELLTALTRPLRRRVNEALESVQSELDQLTSLVHVGAEPFGMHCYPQGIVIKTEFLVPGAAVVAKANTAAAEALLLSLVAGTTDAKKAA
jgi:hypothetical protein